MISVGDVGGRVRHREPSADRRVLVADTSPALTKECSQYFGHAGEYCTIVSSNLGAIAPGSKVFYFEAAGSNGLDSHLTLYAGPGNVALGHVTLSFTTATGVITFRGGTGYFRKFRARADVTYDPTTNLWHWDGTYRFRGH